jgi:hypothetical protein
MTCLNSNAINTDDLALTDIKLPVSIAQVDNDKSRIVCGLIDYNAYKKAINGDKVTVKINVVWSNEHHPICIADLFYRLYRRFKYKRVQDIQTLYLNYNNCRIVSIESGNFTENKDYTFNYKKLTKHLSYNYSADRSKYDEYGNSIVYVATWNHIFSITDNNPGMDKTLMQLGKSIKLYKL